MRINIIKAFLMPLIAALSLASCGDMMEDFYKNSGADFRTDIYVFNGGNLFKSTDGGMFFPLPIITGIDTFAVVEKEVLYSIGAVLFNTKGVIQSFADITISITNDIYGNFYIQANGGQQNIYTYNGSLNQANSSLVTGAPYSKMWVLKFKEQNLIYGAAPMNLYVSADGGSNFIMLNTISGLVSDMIVNNDNSIICTVGNDLYKSNDSMNFSPVYPASSFVALAVDSKNRIYAATSSMIYISENGGDNWYTTPQMLSGSELITDIAVDHNDTLYILNTFAGTEGLFISKNQCQSYSQLNTISGTKIEIVEYQDR